MSGLSSSGRAGRLFSIPVVVEGLVLIWFLLLLHEALGSGFRGGRFITATLLFGTALTVVVLVRDVVVALWSDAKPREAGETPVTTDEDGDQTPNWRLIGASVATMVGFFAAILVLGTVLGIVVTAWIILRVHSKLGAVSALVGALALGAVMPAGFAYLLDLNLWPGLLPPIIPDWIGGGLLPPL